MPAKILHQSKDKDFFLLTFIFLAEFTSFVSLDKCGFSNASISNKNQLHVDVCMFVHKVTV